MSESATKVKWTSGAFRASHDILAKFGRVHEDWAKTCAELISLATRDGEMAELLREVIEWQATNADHLSRSLSAELRAMAKNAETLLAEIE